MHIQSILTFICSFVFSASQEQISLNPEIKKEDGCINAGLQKIKNRAKKKWNKLFVPTPIDPYIAELEHRNVNKIGAKHRARNEIEMLMRKREY